MSTDGEAAIVAAILGSRKYRDVHPETIRGLVQTIAPRHRRPRDVDKAVRRRLHGIVADHLGDPDYDALSAATNAAFEAEDTDQVRQICEQALRLHLSTRERLPYMRRFYTEIFAITGPAAVVLDLACGLAPLALPWMGLAAEARYLGYDIHAPRVTHLDRFVRRLGQPGGVQLRDVVFDPPDEQADVALLLKELHRLQRNYDGIDAAFLARIPARYLVVSLPAVSAHGGRRLEDHYRRMMARMLDGLGWAVEQRLFEHEIVFCIDTGRARAKLDPYR